MASGGEGLTFSEAHGGDEGSDGNSAWENLTDLFSDNNEVIGNDENSNNDTNSGEPSYDFDGRTPDKDANNVEKDGLERLAEKLKRTMGNNGERPSNERQVVIDGLLQDSVVCVAVGHIIDGYFSE